MKFNKLSINTFVLVLISAVMAMASNSIAPLTFGDTETDVDNWNYLINYKMWGQTGISFGNNSSFVSPDGWIGSATGNLNSTGNSSKIAGAIIVGDSIKNTYGMKLTTGPIRYRSYISNSGNASGTICNGYGTSGSCADVPQYRNIPVPYMKENSWPSNLQNITTPDHGTYTIDTRSGSADLYFNNINFGQESRLLILMPEGGRLTRIFAKNLNIDGNSTHPQIVVQYDGDKSPRCHSAYGASGHDCSGGEYEGNLIIYIEKGFTLQNIDYAPFVGTIISGGTIQVTCNTSLSGQLWAKNLIIGNEIGDNAFKYVPLNNNTQEIILAPQNKTFEENNSWNQINLALNKPSETNVTFEYCFDFNSATGVDNVYAGLQDVGSADANNAFPICSNLESRSATIKAGNTKATGIAIKPLVDGNIEADEILGLKITNLKGAQLASYYKNDLGYKITIINSDKLPAVSKALTINVNEDATHTFTISEFNFQHATQTFKSVIITGLPTAGSLTYNGKAVTRDQQIAVADLGKLVFSPKANEFGNKYTTFKYKVVGDGVEGGNTSMEYTATVNVIPVNDKPYVTTNDNNEVVFTIMEDGTLSSGKAEVKDVSNERSVDTYTFKLENVTGSDYTEFNKTFEIVKDNSQNATVQLKSGARLDYSTKMEYVVYATVSDDAKTEKNAGVTNSGTLTTEKFKIIVKVKNINDAPTISSQTFEIYEKQPDGSDWPVNTEVGQITTASDPDGDKLTYSLPSNVPFKFITPKNGTENNMLVVKDGSQNREQYACRQGRQPIGLRNKNELDI